MQNNDFRRKLNCTAVLFFILTAIILLFANRHVIAIDNIEAGDFAANSLLIQDAKHFALLFGNYSRVGFNHPGPAILYVLTLGELLFHDTLHLVKSPFSGQLVAVAIYNAFWIALTFRLVGKACGSITSAILCTLLFALLSGLSDHTVYTGAWFPDLYFFPFAVVIAATAALLRGESDSLPSLAIAVGFLINGHVSFGAMLALLCIFTILANRALYAKSDSRRLNLAFVRRNKGAILRAVVILFLFFIPLAIATIKYFPGPIAQYASFGGKHRPNTIGQMLRYTSVYWGGPSMGLFGLFVLGTLCIKKSTTDQRFTEGTKSLAVTMIGATLVAMFYARYGVDMLDMTYIELFYFGVPALTAGVVAICWLRALQFRPKRIIAYALSLGAVIGIFVLAKKPIDYENQYNVSGITTLYQGILKQKKADKETGPYVLDLDNAGTPGLGWGTVLGIQAYSARRDETPLFCVGKNWHISNTRRAQCTPDQILHGAHLIARDASLPVGTNDLSPIGTGNGITIFAVKPPLLHIGDGLTVAKNAALFDTAFLQTGWSSAEGDFVWSEGKQALLHFNVSPGSKGTFRVDLSAFLPAPTATQSVTISVNGASTHTTFTTAHNRQIVSVPLNLPPLDVTTTTAQKSVDVTVTFAIANPISPQAVGGSSDSRLLGIALHGFTLQAD